MKKKYNTIYRIDARSINQILKTKEVDVTITSPPYFDLKDYGYKAQIGYGQDYETYLEDLRIVFKNIFDCTKETGTLWVIIDAFKRNGEVVPLPFDFSNKIKDIGWKLQEVIIWGKDRTVPWTHKGQMRNLFEYVLMFSKSDNYNFYVDQVRDFETLKRWWVKYPERYNPKGKTPDAIWHFDIPVQGSWGNGYIKHFCPLPEEMIAQILKLTTKEGDLVLDPFAGSGAVLSKANSMKRDYVGFELNQKYIAMFNKYLLETGEAKRKEYERAKNNNQQQHQFSRMIVDLRVLKYARVLYQKIKANFGNGDLKIYVEKSASKPINKNSLVAVNYYLFVLNASKEKIKEAEFNIKLIASKPPLSKYGIEPSFYFIENADEMKRLISGKQLFAYTEKVTHKHSGRYDLDDLSRQSKNVIISKIMVALNENDYI